MEKTNYDLVSEAELPAGFPKYLNSILPGKEFWVCDRKATIKWKTEFNTYEECAAFEHALFNAGFQVGWNLVSIAYTRSFPQGHVTVSRNYSTSEFQVCHYLNGATS